METLTGMVVGMTTNHVMSTSCDTSIYSHELLSTTEVGETIEMLYKETINTIYLTFPSIPVPPKVYKIIYSCKDGKWNKSEKIYGEIVPRQGETYKF